MQNKKRMDIFSKPRVLLLGLLFLMSPFIEGQDNTQEKIAASQGNASLLVYTTHGKDIPSIVLDNYHNDSECVVRSGFPNFFSGIKDKKELTVAFIGGSITQGEYCYRLQTSKFIEEYYPNTSFKWINAGVSGTGTDLGAFRIQEQVLDFNPDLVFIEFAVNGGYPDGMEGMIRQIIKSNPHADICLLYTIMTGQTALYQKNEIPPVIKDLESIAEHYQIPSVHMGMEASQMEIDRLLLWKGTREGAEGRILFSNDGIHPIAEGGNLYAAAIARAIMKMEQRKTTPIWRSLPSPLISNDWENAGMYIPNQIAKFDQNWKEIKTKGHPQLRKFNGWFDIVMTSDQKGALFSFRFEGDMFGLFDIGGPEVGQIEVTVNNRRLRFKSEEVGGVRFLNTEVETGGYLLNRFNTYCNNRHRGQYDIFKLKKGIHSVTIRISFEDADKKTILGKNQQEDISKHPEKYDKTTLYLGRILLRGQPLSLDDKNESIRNQKRVNKK